MKKSWFLPFEDGQRTIKKDTVGFWTVKCNARCNQARHNPYVFPSAVSHIRAAIQILLTLVILNQRCTFNPRAIVIGCGGTKVQHQGVDACWDVRTCSRVHRVPQY
jgi:hypothetical protein